MQRVVCGDCNHVLYEGTELRPPLEIVKEYNGKCPKCGKKLRYNPRNVDFVPSPSARR